MLLLFAALFSNAQVGINTENPHPSSALDITSTTSGMLTPRMTSVQRLAIASPANGLMVFDTDLNTFMFYSAAATKWNTLQAAETGRTKYKLVKASDNLSKVLAAELAAGGTTYKLDPGTYYEINGMVMMDKPIELNNAYLSGLDSGEDMLVNTSGDALFVGSTGGSVSKLTLVGASKTKILFNISNTSEANTENLIFRDCIVTKFLSVGTIEGLSMTFFSIIMFSDNATGLVFKGTNASQKVLLHSVGWFLNNTGIFEKFEGTFGLIQKQGGFSEVYGTAVGFDVASNPTVTNGILESVAFRGTGKYVSGYNPATYAGYNFNNNWHVTATGIPEETDSRATGFLYDNNIEVSGNISPTRITFQNTTTPYKVTLGTNATELFRMQGTTTGRLTYKGTKKRAFTITATMQILPVTPNGNPSTSRYYFYIRRYSGANSVELSETKTITDSNAGFFQTVIINGVVSLNPDDAIEIWGYRKYGNYTDIDIFTLNMMIR